MSDISNHIHPEFSRQLTRKDKEKLLGQKGLVVWMYGMSGSGKSTIANAAEKVLHQEGHMTTILDGDNLRTGLNQHLGFSDDDRRENIRRVSHVAKLFAQQGILTLVSVITPRQELRDLARDVIGNDYFFVGFCHSWAIIKSIRSSCNNERLRACFNRFNFYLAPKIIFLHGRR